MCAIWTASPSPQYQPTLVVDSAENEVKWGQNIPLQFSPRWHNY
jgi:hypothetical protein